MKKLKSIIIANWQLYVLLAPALIYVFIFDYLPMYGVQIAFRDYSTRKGVWESTWVGLEHFERFIRYPNFDLLIRNTLSISLYALLTVPFPIIFALMINELQNPRFKRMAQMISYMPYFLSTVVVCSMIMLMLDRRAGVINSLLVLCGLERVDFLTIPEYFNDIYVWSDLWQSVGWDSIIYIAALAGVSQELVEAARIDGAGRLRMIWHIYLPHITPTIMVILILNCGRILSVGFEKAYLLQNPLNLSSSQLLSTYVYEIGIRGSQFSYSSAIGLFNNLVNCIVLCFVNYMSKKTTNNSIW